MGVGYLKNPRHCLHRAVYAQYWCSWYVVIAKLTVLPNGLQLNRSSITLCRPEGVSRLRLISMEDIQRADSVQDKLASTQELITLNDSVKSVLDLTPG